MRREALKAEAAMAAGLAVRYWWVGRCPKCGNARSAVEVGQGDTYSRSALESFGYEVKQEPGPVQFRPHAKECGA
jgi:hypothetical protein